MFIRYDIYGKDKDGNNICDCSFDTKVIAIDCLIHFINYIALKDGFKIYKDESLKLVLKTKGKYEVGGYSFWVEERKI